jgi:hypothetical protein
MGERKSRPLGLSLPSFGQSLGSSSARGPLGLNLKPPNLLPPVRRGPLGVSPQFGEASEIPRPAFGFGFADHLDAGIVGPSRFSDTELEQAMGELELLKRIFGTISDEKGRVRYTQGISVKIKGRKRPTKRVEKYLRDRALFFGSNDGYFAYLAKARAELDNTKNLRNTVEPPAWEPLKKGQTKEDRKPSLARRIEGWQKGQDVFYAWVRRAIEDEVGAGVNVGDLIMSGVSEKLSKALAKVKADVGPFKYGGMNPRPRKKKGYGYRFGTMSEHALGNAIDIEPEKNPQIQAPVWAHVTAYIKRPMARAARAAMWKSNPKGLYDYIQGVSTAFAKRLAEAVAAKRKANDKLDQDAALAAAVKDDKHLTGAGLKFVVAWQSGFFSLSWELVEALHEQKFVWGATFDTVDLHHFDFG